MSGKGIEPLRELIKRNPPQTQEAACALGARMVIAALGPVHDDRAIIATSIGMARGLFGPAFARATPSQQYFWVRMCERAYRDALAAPTRPGS